MAKEKDPFKDLDLDEKDTLAALDNEELVDRIAKVAMDQEDNKRNEEEDQDLASLKEQVKIAGEQYKDATKQNRLRIRFMKRCLEDRGFANTVRDKVKAVRSVPNDQRGDIEDEFAN